MQLYAQRTIAASFAYIFLGVIKMLKLLYIGKLVSQISIKSKHTLLTIKTYNIPPKLNPEPAKHARCEAPCNIEKLDGVDPVRFK